MKVNKRIAGAMVGVALLVGILGSGVVLAQESTPGAPPAAAQVPTEGEDGPDDLAQEPSYSGSITVDQTQYDNLSELDEAAALQGLALISADDAKAAAEGANSGTTAVKVELDNENGVLVYSVELSNGLDVKVDAGNGQVVHTEQAGEDVEAGDKDKVQEEHGSQIDDAFETSGAKEVEPEE